MRFLLLGVRILSLFSFTRAFSSSLSPACQRTVQGSVTNICLNMARTRGLERSREGATPEDGGMTLFLKASQDGTSIGDCPFAHAVRLVLEEKGLAYDVRPCTAETKPDWLVEFYEGKMPALRHRKECYVESSVIMEYLEFFFQNPVSLKASPSSFEGVLDGFFPTVAQYLKDTTDDPEKLTNLREKLSALEDHLSENNPFLCGASFSLLDCRLVPQLYHLQIAAAEYKKGIPNLMEDYPSLSKYYGITTVRSSFTNTVYPVETVLWGWGNARN